MVAVTFSVSQKGSVGTLLMSGGQDDKVLSQISW